MRIKANVLGVEQVIQEVIDETVKSAREGIFEMGEDIYLESQALTPVWTGTLLSTAFMIRDGETEEVTVGYARKPFDAINPETGKMASEYAWEVHEEGVIYNVMKPIWILDDSENGGHYEYEEVEYQSHGPYKYLSTAAEDVLRRWTSYFQDLPVKVTENTNEPISIEGDDLDAGVIPF